MEGFEEDDIPCSSLAVDSFVRLGVAGSAWGMFLGPYEANKQGLTGISRASFVVKSVGKYGLQCGLFGGLFSAMHCGVRRYRMQKDWGRTERIMLENSNPSCCFPALQGRFDPITHSTGPSTLYRRLIGEREVNASIAGAVTGAALAAKTRSFFHVLRTAVLVSMIATAAEYSRTI